MASKGKRGPTREQLTDQQWSDVCRLFDTIARIGRRITADLEQAQGRA